MYVWVSKTCRSWSSCNWCTRNMTTMEINSATNVLLKAVPRLSVTPAMSPSTARWAWPRASPIPRTVPMNPTEGMAQAI